MENLQGGTLALEHRYHVQQRVSCFSFATTYNGLQEPFERPVFITVFDALHEAGAKRDLYDRLKQAAQRASSLDAPGILRTIDYGELDEGVPFVIWERTDAKPLSDYLETHATLPPQNVAALITRLSSVLAAAHEANIPHGSLSARWVFVQGDELAQATLGHFQLGLTLRELLAMPSAVLGPEAVSALPPEMFDVARTPGQDDPRPGDGFSPAADVYALGAIAYFALVGVHPYFDDPGDASEGILRIKSEDAPDLSELGIDKAVSAAVARALSRNPRQRWPDAAAFARALEAATLPPAKASKNDVLPVAAASASKSSRSSSAEELATPKEPARTPEPGEARPERAAAPPIEPNGYLLAAAIAVLLISNLIWFFAFVQQHDQNGTTEPPAQLEAPLTTSILPSGVQLSSEPPGAQIFLLDGTTANLLGTTPYSLNGALRGRERAQLELRMHGFENFRVVLKSDHAGQDLLLPLLPLTAKKDH
ncbi:MAG: hypothetical protein H0U74_13010 [Bradymonadaceae bacterium]|nr:hypothetical protein [Lujinxingiaceae bacterium]